MQKESVKTVSYKYVNCLVKLDMKEKMKKKKKKNISNDAISLSSAEMFEIKEKYSLYWRRYRLSN